jgi:hypothetical protein
MEKYIDKRELKIAAENKVADKFLELAKNSSQIYFSQSNGTYCSKGY